MRLLHSFMSLFLLWTVPYQVFQRGLFLEEETDGEEGRRGPGKARAAQGAAAGGAGRAAGVGQASAHSQGVCAARGDTRLLGLRLYLLGVGKSSFSPRNVGCIVTKHKIASR